MLILDRYANPSKHVLEPYGTICKNGNEYFIQVSMDVSNSANWITLGDFFSKCFVGSDLNEDFIKECLDIYQMKNVNPELFERP